MLPELRALDHTIELGSSGPASSLSFTPGFNRGVNVGMQESNRFNGLPN
jgi:hypothetical protein